MFYLADSKDTIYSSRVLLASNNLPNFEACEISTCESQFSILNIVLVLVLMLARAPHYMLRLVPIFFKGVLRLLKYTDAFLTPSIGEIMELKQERTKAFNGKRRTSRRSGRVFLLTLLQVLPLFNGAVAQTVSNQFSLSAILFLLLNDDSGSTGGGGGVEGEYVLLAANDLGMHCADQDHQVFSILPPFNVVHAQVVKRGFTPVIMDDELIAVDYLATSSPDDPVGAGSINTGNANSTDVFKSNFWETLTDLGNPVSFLTGNKTQGGGSVRCVVSQCSGRSNVGSTG